MKYCQNYCYRKQKNNMSKTILKWAGGKKIIIQKIKERLEKINNKENVTFLICLQVVVQ